MKIKSGQLSPDAALRRRGVAYTIMRNGELHLATWPKKPTKPQSYAQKWYRAQFGAAAKLASTPWRLDYITATYMAKPFINPPRDLLTQAALGNLYEFVNPDGSVWPRDPHKPIPQEDEPGTGGNGDDEMIEWAGQPWATSKTVVQGNAAGIVWTPTVAMTLKGCRAMIDQTVGQQYDMYFCEMTAPATVKKVISKSTKYGLATGTRVLDFDADGNLDANSTYALIMCIPSKTVNHSSLLRQSSAGQLPLPTSFFASVYKEINAISAGDVLWYDKSFPFTVAVKT